MKNLILISLSTVLILTTKTIHADQITECEEVLSSAAAVIIEQDAIIRQLDELNKTLHKDNIDLEKQYLENKNKWYNNHLLLIGLGFLAGAYVGHAIK